MRIKRSLGRWLVFVLVWALCFQALGIVAADISSPDDLGWDRLERYNGIVFDYFESAQADIEGAVAIGGPSRIATGGQFDFGASGGHPVMGTYPRDGYPTLVLGGEPTLGAGQRVQVNIYGGDVVMADWVRPFYQAQNNVFSFWESGRDRVKYAEDEAVRRFFAQAELTAWNTVNTLGESPTASVAFSSFSGWGTGYRDTFRDLSRFEDFTTVGGARMLVVHVTDQKPVIREPGITSAFADYDYIVFDFPNAVDVQFTGGSLMVDGAQLNTGADITHHPQANKLLGHYASRVIWNFPQASTVKVTACGVVGSVFAPGALVEGNGGSINGMLIAESFITKGGCELHSFNVGGGIFGLGPSAEVTEGRVVLYKYDEDNSTSFEDYQLIDGAWFELFRYDDNGTPQSQGSYEADEGRLVLEQLQPGDYYLVETVSPEGYHPSTGEEFPFTIHSGMTHADTIYFYVPNKPYTAALELVKWDDAYTQRLPGARYALYYISSSNPLLIGQGTTDSNGSLRVNGLREGDYALVELEAPEGYQADSRLLYIRVKIDGAGTVTVETCTDGASYFPLGSHTVEVANSPLAPDKFHVVVAKVVEGYPDLPISGVEFLLYEDTNYDPNDPTLNWQEYQANESLHQWSPVGNGLHSQTTNELGHIYYDLPQGYYKLVESDDVTVVERFFVPMPAAVLLPFPLGAPVQAELEGALTDSTQPQLQPDDTQEEPPDLPVTEPQEDDESDPAATPHTGPEEGEGDPPASGPEAADELQSDADAQFQAVEPASAPVESLFAPDPDAVYLEQLELPRVTVRPVSQNGSLFDVFEEEDYLDRLDLGGAQGTAQPLQEELPAEGNPQPGLLHTPVQQPGQEEPLNDQADGQPHGEDGDTDDDADTDDDSDSDSDSGSDGDSGGNGQPGRSHPDGADGPEPEAGGQEPSQPETDPEGGPPPSRAPAGSMRWDWEWGGIFIEIENPAVGRIEVLKQDDTTFEPVPGAVFALYYNLGSYDFGGNHSNRWIRVDTAEATGPDARAVFENLIDGDYRVMEVQAPDGYEEIVSPEPVPVTPDEINQSGDYQVTIASGNPDTERFTFLARNPYAAGSIRILKRDGDDGAPLYGARFNLQYWDEDQHAWLRWNPYSHTVNGDYTIHGLPYGRYKIVESTPPDGYQVDREYDRDELIFTIRDNGLYSGAPVVVDNFVIPPGGGGGGGGGGGNGGEYNPDREIAVFYPMVETDQPEPIPQIQPPTPVDLEDNENPLTGLPAGRVMASGLLAAAICLLASQALAVRRKRD